MKFTAKIPSPIFNFLLDPVAESSDPADLVKILYSKVAELGKGLYTTAELATFEASALATMANLAKSLDNKEKFDPTKVLSVRKILCPECKAYFVIEKRCSNAKCRGDIIDEEEEFEFEEDVQPTSEEEANQIWLFKRWNVEAKKTFGGGITTSNNNHPIVLERAGDFDEDMQDQFFFMMSHILQALAAYPSSKPDNFTLAEFKLSTKYSDFRNCISPKPQWLSGP